MKWSRSPWLFSPAHAAPWHRRVVAYRQCWLCVTILYTGLFCHSPLKSTNAFIGVPRARFLYGAACEGQTNIHVRGRRRWKSILGPNIVRKAARVSADEGANRPSQPREWFEMNDTMVCFGAESPIDVALAGSMELAREWLLGSDVGDDSIDRLVHAARPVGAEIRRSGTDADGKQSYLLELPSLDLLGLGVLKSSVTMWGMRRDSGGPQPDGGEHLDIGSGGGPKVALTFAGTGQEFSFPRFGLDVRGALGIAEGPRESGRAVGWVSIRVEGEPRLAGLALPEEVLRPAAREVCRLTVGFATRRVAENLAQDFAVWRGKRVRAERLKSRNK